MAPNSTWLRHTHLRLLAVIALLIGLLGSLGPARIAQAASLTVTTTADELNADGDCSLREAVRAANLNTAVDRCPAGASADTITVPAGVYTLSRAGANEDAALTGDLDLIGTLTITGAGAAATIIDGGALDRVFDVLAGANITLNGLTIRNGYRNFSSDRRALMGAGVYNAAALTINVSVVANNSIDASNIGDDYTQMFGGGLYNEGALTIINSTVSGNHAQAPLNAGYGAGVYSTGGLTLTNSSVTGNFGLKGAGLFNDGGQVQITSSVINNNYAGNSLYDSGVGGGIVNVGEGSLSLVSSSVSNNTAGAPSLSASIGGGSGGIFNGGTATITRSNISDNRADGGGGSGQDGGIGNHGTMTVTESAITGNSAGGGSTNFPCDSGGSGGGIGNTETLTLINSTVSRNSVSGSRCDASSGNGGGSGGGIANRVTSTLTLISSTIASNSATQGQRGNDALWPATGGGVANAGAFFARNTILAGNRVDNTATADCSGSLISQGYNLIGSTSGCTVSVNSGDLLNVAPLIGPLRDNGGPTPTHALLPGSPALDAGNTGPPGSGVSCLATDQRGVPRPQDGNSNGFSDCDIGAVERQDSLVLNGGFEADANGDGKPDGWSSDSHITRSSADRHSGSYALRHQASDNASYTVYSDPAAPIIAGRSYLFSAWTNIPATSDSFSFEWQVRWRDASGNILSTVTVHRLSAATGAWGGIVTIVVAPPGATQATIRQVVSSLNATIYVDNVWLHPIDNLIINDSFEEDANGDGAPDAWSANAHAARSNALVRSGSYALRHQASDNASYTVYSDPVAPIVASQTYGFSGWVNIPSTSDSFSFELQVRWRDASGAILRTESIKTFTAPTAGWTLIWTTLSPPIGATQATIRQVVSSLNATIYVDDLALGP